MSQVIVCRIVSLLIDGTKRITWENMNERSRMSLEKCTLIFDSEWTSLVPFLRYYMHENSYILIIRRCIFLFCEYMFHFILKSPHMDLQTVYIMKQNVKYFEEVIVQRLKSESVSLSEKLATSASVCFEPIKLVLRLLSADSTDNVYLTDVDIAKLRERDRYQNRSGNTSDILYRSVATMFGSSQTNVNNHNLVDDDGDDGSRITLKHKNANHVEWTSFCLKAADFYHGKQNNFDFETILMVCLFLIFCVHNIILVYLFAT